MKKLKRCFFVLVFGLLLGTAATFACSTECQANNAEANGFQFSHSADTCHCNYDDTLHTVILGSTHTYTILPNENITFKDAMWNFIPEYNPDDNNISISLDDGGKNATIRFIQTGTYTLSATMTDTDNHTYKNSISINVVSEKIEGVSTKTFAVKGQTLSLLPQFKTFSTEHPDGILTAFTNNITWSYDSINSMNPVVNDNRTLSFTPTQSGEYTIFVTLKVPTSSGSRNIQSQYTVYIAESAISTDEEITIIGDTAYKMDIRAFTPQISGNYKITWKTNSNIGVDTIYDSNGNIAPKTSDVYHYSVLEARKTYYIVMIYNHLSASNTYCIKLYDSGSSDTSDSTPSVPSGHPSQGSDVDGNNDHIAGSNDNGNTGNGNSNTGNVINNNNNTASTQVVSVSKVKGKPKLKLKKGKVKLTFKKVKGADGYEIRYATNKKFKKSKKITVKSPKATLKKLKKGKKYFVKIRAFKRNAASQKVYGAYSKVVKINVK